MTITLWTIPRFLPLGLITGTPGNDTLVGTSGNDTLDGLAGADLMKGGQGNDLYRVDNAGDIVTELLDQGLDTVQASVSYTLSANVENLTLVGASNLLGTGNVLNNLIEGNTGANGLNGMDGDDSLHGGNGADTLNGGAGMDFLYGDAGNDTLVGGADSTADFLDGGTGNDSLDGGVGAAALYGNDGNDTLRGGSTPGDLLFGGNGNDSLMSGSAGDILNGEDGADTLVGSAGADSQLSGGGGNDSINAGAGNDNLSGDAGSDTLLGGEGNDFLVDDQNKVADTLSGGNGMDILNADWHTSTDAVIWINDPTQTQVVNGNSVSGIERLYIETGSGNDVISDIIATGDDDISSGAGNDSISSGGGIDGLSGDAGNDTLTGGASNDYLTGGAGADTFSFDSLVGFDVVTDFGDGSDKLRISQAALKVGDGDLVVEGATVISSPGGFAASAELVIASANISGDFTTAKVAAVIGHSASAYSVGQTAIFAVDNGVDSAVYYFKSADANNTVSASELTLLAALPGINETSTTDFVFGA